MKTADLPTKRTRITIFEIYLHESISFDCVDFICILILYSKNELQIEHFYRPINIVMTHLSFSNRIFNVFLMNFDYCFPWHSMKKVAGQMNLPPSRSNFNAFFEGFGRQFGKHKQIDKHMTSKS